MIDKHQSTISQVSVNSVFIQHQLDTTSYNIGVQWKGNATPGKKHNHYYVLTPAADTVLSLPVCF